MSPRSDHEKDHDVFVSPLGVGYLRRQRLRGTRSLYQRGQTVLKERQRKGRVAVGIGDSVRAARGERYARSSESARTVPVVIAQLERSAELMGTQRLENAGKSCG